jgi:hypothetical protein
MKFVYFSKICRENFVSLKPDKNKVYFHDDQYKCLITSRSILHIMRNISEKIVEKHKTRILFSTFFILSEIIRLRDNLEKYCITGQSADEFGACELHYGYLRSQKHTHNVQYLLLFHCNNNCTKAP